MSQQFAVSTHGERVFPLVQRQFLPQRVAALAQGLDPQFVRLGKLAYRGKRYPGKRLTWTNRVAFLDQQRIQPAGASDGEFLQTFEGHEHSRRLFGDLVGREGQ